KCVGEQYLQEKILGVGHIQTCSYCQERNKSTELSSLAGIIQTALDEHYQCTPDQPDAYEYAYMKEFDREWERSGECLNYVIQEMAAVDEPIAKDVEECLLEDFDPHCGEMYDDDPHYELSDPSDWQLRNMWEEFQKEITSRSRFFSPTAKNILDEIFQDIASLKTSAGKSAIITIQETDKSPHIYRARIANSPTETEQILKNPQKELGAPPALLATAGRMNAHGISVFYGAKEIETCINEIRPPVGSTVIVGKFTVLRSLNLLDFEVLTQITTTKSIFDPMCAKEKQQAAFFKIFIDEISRPILPADEQVDYTPTQIVAEYLANVFSPHLDGFVFHSAQSGTKSRNIVLFYAASKVEDYDLPEGSTVEVSWGHDTEDGYKPEIIVWERVTEETPQKEQISLLDKLFTPNADSRFDTLRLDVKNLIVYPIQGVKYDHPSNGNIERYRMEKRAGVVNDF
ncbi:MAG: RES family NAD+ phosphorylase, partial [Kiritimatiellales bacterium]